VTELARIGSAQTLTPFYSRPETSSLSKGRHIARGQPTDTEIKQHSIEFRDDENAEGTLHAKGANCETPVIHARRADLV